MDSHRGSHARHSGGERHGVTRRRQVFSDSDHDEPADARSLGTRNDLVRAVRKVLRLEVAVRIDQTRGKGHGAGEYGARADVSTKPGSVRQDRRVMNTPTEQDFRTLFDDRGILRPGALASPLRTRAYTVFAQRKDARVEIDLWERHASQFFEARLGLVVPKRYDFDAPKVDAARVVLLPTGGDQGIRLCYGRPRADDDLRIAEDADTRAGSPGLGLLARRCPTVWLVETSGDSDRLSLLLAAILASVVLGPILSPDGRELFGVRTARTKLE
jgi:hypothetical protein